MQPSDVVAVCGARVHLGDREVLFRMRASPPPLHPGCFAGTPPGVPAGAGHGDGLRDGFRQTGAAMASLAGLRLAPPDLRRAGGFAAAWPGASGRRSSGMCPMLLRSPGAGFDKARWGQRGCAGAVGMRPRTRKGAAGSQGQGAGHGKGQQRSRQARQYANSARKPTPEGCHESVLWRPRSRRSPFRVANPLCGQKWRSGFLRCIFAPCFPPVHDVYRHEIGKLQG